MGRLKIIDFERRNGGSSYQEILASGGGVLDTVKWVGQETKQELKRNFTKGLDVIRIMK